MPSTRQHDAGFTLIELLISITILGILMAAVSAAMMVGLGTNASTGTRIDESRDEQFIAAYFSADANGAQTITAGDRAPNCRFAGGGGTVIVSFVGQDFTDDATPTVNSRTVSYVKLTAPDGRAEVHRLVCADGASNPGPGGSTTLARQVTAGSASCINAACSGVELSLTSGSLSYTLAGYKRTT